MNKIDLAGRHAVVTGAAQGIGFAIATRLLDSGAAVAIWDQDVDLMRQAAQSLGSRGEVQAAVDSPKEAGLQHNGLDSFRKVETVRR